MKRKNHDISQNMLLTITNTVKHKIESFRLCHFPNFAVTTFQFIDFPELTGDPEGDGMIQVHSMEMVTRCPVPIVWQVCYTIQKKVANFKLNFN